MASLDRQQTTFYFKSQSGKGVEATMDGSEAIELTYDSAALPFKPMANDVVRNNIRLSRLPQATLPVGKWGETPNPLGVEMHGSGTVGTAPEFGPFLTSLLGDETIVASTSVTYSITTAGDTTWYTAHSFVDGVKVSGVDTRCRSWGISAAVGEIITQTYGLMSLTAEETDTADPNTPTIDGLSVPFVAQDMTFTIEGSPKCCKSVELTTANPKIQRCINDPGVSDLPEDSALTIEGTMVVVAEDDTEMTNYFGSILSDIVIAGSATNNAVTETVTITLTDCQYGAVDSADDEGTVEYSVPFIVTGGVVVAFT